MRAKKNLLLREASKKYYNKSASLKTAPYGIVYSLTHDEIDVLYAKSGLTAYVTEALMVELKDDSSIVALSCNLLIPPSDDESNDEYFQKLIKCINNYELEIPQNV